MDEKLLQRLTGIRLARMKLEELVDILRENDIFSMQSEFELSEPIDRLQQTLWSLERSTKRALVEAMVNERIEREVEKRVVESLKEAPRYDIF